MTRSRNDAGSISVGLLEVVWPPFRLDTFQPWNGQREVVQHRRLREESRRPVFRMAKAGGGFSEAPEGNPRNECRAPKPWTRGDKWGGDEAGSPLTREPPFR